MGGASASSSFLGSSSRHPLVASSCPWVVWGRCGGGGSHQELTWSPDDVGCCLGPWFVITTIVIPEVQKKIVTRKCF